MIDIDKLEMLAKAAGGETWSTETGRGTFDSMYVWYEDGDSVCRVFGNLGHMPEPVLEEELAEYIAAVNPASIRALIAEVRALREDKARLDWLDKNMFHREKNEYDARIWRDHTMWVAFAPSGIQGSARKIVDAARGVA
jgi:hypothetical protein